MARVTVEDCVEIVPNRFELVVLAAQRSREISAGAELTVDRDNDKNPVVALREIADETIDFGEREETLIRGLQRFIEADEPEEAVGGSVAVPPILGAESGTEAVAAGNSRRGTDRGGAAVSRLRRPGC